MSFAPPRAPAGPQAQPTFEEALNQARRSVEQYARVVQQARRVLRRSQTTLIDVFQILLSPGVTMRQPYFNHLVNTAVLATMDATENAMRRFEQLAYTAIALEGAASTHDHFVALGDLLAQILEFVNEWRDIQDIAVIQCQQARDLDHHFQARQ